MKQEKFDRQQHLGMKSPSHHRHHKREGPRHEVAKKSKVKTVEHKQKSWKIKTDGGKSKNFFRNAHIDGNNISKPKGTVTSYNLNY